MKSIKNKIRKWLGINEIEEKIIDINKKYSNLVSIGIDVHFKSPSMIIIYSRINGGQIREIEVDIKSYSELNNLVKELKDRYNTEKVVRDNPSFYI